MQPRPSVGFKFHAVLVVNSAHLASLASPDSDRWLPIFWALDYFKSAQAQTEKESHWRMRAVEDARVPIPAQAREAFIHAMDAWDEEAADAAVVGLCRSAEVAGRAGARQRVAPERAGAYERLRAAKESATRPPLAPSEEEPAPEASPESPAPAARRIGGASRPTEKRRTTDHGRMTADEGLGPQGGRPTKDEAPAPPPSSPAAPQGPGDTARRLLDAKRRARKE